MTRLSLRSSPAMVWSATNKRLQIARPTVRPARERHPQPNFIFPITPPQTAGLGSTAGKADADKRPDILDIARLHDSYWTPSQGPTTPNQPLQSFLLDDRSSNRPALRRAVSDSTLRESSVARESDAGGFKIVITKPGDERRPKTVEDIDNKNVPLLEILIPSGKLGTPRWSARGTPFIRGSSYAPTEEFRSSHHHSPLTPRFRSSVASRAAGPAMLRSGRFSTAPRSPALNSGGLSAEHALRSTYLSTHVKIEPAMFDSLTFNPACDDRSIVRYSTSTAAVTAATPPRLVAEITSPTFLDYELLSDFFLTFRSYLAPLDLIKMLFARMRWALARHDEVGTVVRVRTFVALRHWILNYFVDDFVCEYEMRTNFCTLLNSLADEMSQCPKARRVQLKILAELKKCWRRVCAQFWDGPEFDVNLPPLAPITPGGIPGHRNPSLDPDFWKQFFPDEPPRLDAIYAPLASNPPDVETSFVRDVARAGVDESSYVMAYRPGTPENEAGEKTTAGQEAPWSPTSISSAEAASCSLPFKFSIGRSKHPVAAHPVGPYSMHANHEPVATIPRTLTGKRVRPHQSHKRNVSTSDSLREHNVTLEQLIQKNTETILSLPYAGSLVRGNVLPPGQAFVEVQSPSSVYGPSRQTTFLRLEADASTKEQTPPAAMSGHGMRRLIGSVRRALSTRDQDMSPTQGNFNITPIGPRGVTANRLPGTAIVPQSRPRANSARPPVRIDLLGAEIVEDFKRVVREDAAEAAARSFHGSIPSTPTTVRSPVTQADLDSAHIDSLLRGPYEDNKRARAFSDGGVTSGSKSILIIDDTLRVPDEHPTMTGALPAFTPSVEAFADSFMPSGADPTPPSTPPGRNIDTPRRSSYLLGQRQSSYLLGQHVLRSSRSANDLPPFVPDLDSLTGASSMRSSEYPERPSMHPRRRSSDCYRQSLSRPPLTGISRHARHRSSRSSLRRHASFHSGMGRHSTVRSFDATTYSDRNSIDISAGAIPPPLRVLRRRPGGDLRAVNNVVDLGPTGLHRSRSIGSLTTGTFTTSVGTSLIQSSGMARDSTGLLDIVNSDYSRDRAGTFSLGMLAEKPKARRRISLLSTFSSKPIMRPSFEAEAQKLANIPDDDDDGGVESALLKLEGKYKKKVFKLSMEPTNAPLHIADQGKSPSPLPEDQPSLLKAEKKKKHRHEHIVDEGVLPFTPPPSDSPPLPPSRSTLVVVGDEDMQPVREERVEVRSIQSDLSNESYVSIPLLRRGLTDDGRRSRAAWTNRSILQDPDEDGATSADEEDEAQYGPSYEFVQKSESIERIRPGESVPTRERSSTRASQQSQQSFLNVDDTDDDDDDELSSELSEVPFEEDEDSIMAFPTLRPNASLTKIRTAESRSHAVGSERSPPLRMAQQVAMSPHMGGVPELYSTQLYGTKPLPPTPDYTPTFGQSSSPLKRTSPNPAGVNASLRNAAQVIEHEATTRKYSAHLPFILAFESEILAQQFTLIEKDALNEIDWKELIDMRWKNAEHNDARSWVHFLRDTDARGVEVVIARFNIVVKWAISEIVLTQNIEERARCIIKFIHIAAHCRRYRNFATMSQIAVALTSGEIGRLTETWRWVPPQDIRTLRELETLISPTRNFYALRAEMEGGGLASAGMGCIPFVGIYTHDLIFNSQRPCEIASSPTTAPLVNFERCRIAAGIVKALLRLLEASTLYNFEPIEGITERCLWMSALSDEEIRRHSESLE